MCFATAAIVSGDAPGRMLTSKRSCSNGPISGVASERDAGAPAELADLLVADAGGDEGLFGRIDGTGVYGTDLDDLLAGLVDVGLERGVVGAGGGGEERGEEEQGGGRGRGGGVGAEGASLRAILRPGAAGRSIPSTDDRGYLRR